MKTALLIPVLAFTLLTAYAQTPQKLAGDSFRLTVERVITNQSVVVSLLKIQVSHSAFVSVDSEEHSHIGVQLVKSHRDATGIGQIALGASRIITHQGDHFAYIQTFVRAESSGNFAGGPSISQVPAATTLDSFFSVSATSGDYKCDTPVKIGDLNGKPVTLIVGKPIK